MFHNSSKLIFPNRMATLLEPDDTYQRRYMFLSSQFNPLSFNPNEQKYPIYLSIGRELSKKMIENSNHVGKMLETATYK